MIPPLSSFFLSIYSNEQSSSIIIAYSQFVSNKSLYAIWIALWYLNAEPQAFAVLYETFLMDGIQWIHLLLWQNSILPET